MLITKNSLPFIARNGQHWADMVNRDFLLGDFGMWLKKNGKENMILDLYIRLISKECDILQLSLYVTTRNLYILIFYVRISVQ